MFKIWPTNRFSKAKSYSFHFHENYVTWPLSANGLSHPKLQNMCTESLIRYKLQLLKGQHICMVAGLGWCPCTTFLLFFSLINTGTLKFKIQLKFLFLTAVNHLSWPLKKQKFAYMSSKVHGLWFLTGGFQSILCVSVFQGLLLVIIIKNNYDSNSEKCNFYCKLAIKFQSLCVIGKCSNCNAAFVSEVNNPSQALCNTHTSRVNQLPWNVTELNVGIHCSYCMLCISTLRIINILWA